MKSKIPALKFFFNIILPVYFFFLLRFCIDLGEYFGIEDIELGIVGMKAVWGGNGTGVGWWLNGDGWWLKWWWWVVMKVVWGGGEW